MHWINVSDEGKWALKSAVIGMKGITGDHSGKNLGRFVVAVCDRIIDEELAKAKQAGDAARYAAYEKSAQLMRDLIRSPQFVEFLTVPAYQKILSEGN